MSVEADGILMKRLITFLVYAGLLLSLVSCNLPAGQDTPGPQAWIDAPLSGSVLQSNTLIDVISHASDTSGITLVELDINNTALHSDSVPEAGQGYVKMNQTWTPSQPGTYEIRVRARAGSGQWSPYAVVSVTVANLPTGTPTRTNTPTESPTPQVTKTPGPSPTPANPTFKLIENGFCHTGPDTSFAATTAIPNGDIVDIRGISGDGFWYFVFWKQFKASCWVAAHAGLASGNLTGLPVLASPPTPTHTPLPTATARKP